MKSLAPINHDNDLVTLKYCTNNFLTSVGGGTLLENFTKNLIPNSWNLKAVDWNIPAPSLTEVSSLPDGSKYVAKGTAWGGFTPHALSNIELGKLYSYSFDLENEEGIRFAIFGAPNFDANKCITKTNLATFTSLPAGKKRIYFTFKADDAEAKKHLSALRIESTIADKRYKISKPQLELGEPTDYFPNINDFIK